MQIDELLWNILFGEVGEKRIKLTIDQRSTKQSQGIGKGMMIKKE